MDQSEIVQVEKTLDDIIMEIMMELDKENYNSPMKLSEIS